MPVTSAPYHYTKAEPAGQRPLVSQPDPAEAPQLTSSVTSIVSWTAVGLRRMGRFTSVMVLNVPLVEAKVRTPNVLPGTGAKPPARARGR